MTKQVTIHKCPVCKRNVQRLASHMKLAHPDQGAAPPPEKPPDMNDKDTVVFQKESPFTKEELLQSAQRSATIDHRDDEDVEYQCDTCHNKVSRTDKQCPSCGRGLMWGDL